MLPNRHLYKNIFFTNYDLLLLPDPFREMGAWQKNMEPQKPGNSPRPGPEVVEKERVTKERAVQTVRSWTVLTKMRLGQVSVDAA